MRHFKIHQENMYCIMCLINITRALSQIEQIQELEIKLDGKMIKLTYEDGTLSKKEIRTLVNNVFTRGMVS